jgi:hypothetical protein
VSADIKPFRKQFRRQPEEQSVVTFTNLGGDAVLISPRPLVNSSDGVTVDNYAHLAAFILGGPEAQARELWVAVGRAFLRRLSEGPNDRKIWLSTSGLGVYWLHVRLDNVPKYYNWLPYKNS